MSSHYIPSMLTDDTISVLLAVDDRTDDLVYTGPLIAGIKFAMQSRGWMWVEGRTMHTGHVGYECWFGDDLTDPDENTGCTPTGDEDAKLYHSEWGTGPTRPEAIRYALGAMFGPADDEYDEDYLLRMLRTFTDPVPDPLTPEAIARWLDEEGF